MEMLMKKLAIVAAAFCTCLLVAAGSTDGDQPLRLQVSPTTARAPAFVRVHAVIEESDDNRSLEVTAQSPDYFRRSRVDLDGRNAPPLEVFEYSNMPPGLYEVTGVLLGIGGKRATASRLVNVVPMTGSGR
jgi:hypothetical protein